MPDVITRRATRPANATDVLARLRRSPWSFAALLTVALIVANAIANASFLDPGRWPVLLGSLAPFVLVALASTPPVLGGGGGIDISVGPLATLVNCVFIVVLIPHGLGSVWLAIPLLLALGLCVGAVNGLLVIVLRLQPVIATLATFFVLTGVSLKLAAHPTTAPHNWTSGLANTVWGIPGGLVTMGVPAVVWVLLRRARYVDTLCSVGSDDVAAFSAGVGVSRVRFGAYLMSGATGAVAGVALTALIQSSESSLATTYALIALAAVSLGGTSLAGGRGGMLGSFLGACAIFLLQQLLAAVNVSATYLQLVYGALLILGVIVGAQLTRTRSQLVPVP